MKGIMLTDLSPEWVWGIVGLGLLILELLTVSFFLMFFGIAALVVAVLKWTGLNDFATEMTIFSLVGVVGTFFFRSKLVNKLQSRQTGNSSQTDQNQEIHLSADVPAGGQALIEYQGANWTAINNGSETLTAGTKVRIERIDGVKIIITKIC
jgi:membrane protein implicated in regulation of membrane protease activity